MFRRRLIKVASTQPTYARNIFPSQGTFQSGNDGPAVMVYNVKPNTTYKIKRSIYTSRFFTVSCNDYPKKDTPYFKPTDNYTPTYNTLTYTVAEGCSYLAIYFSRYGSVEDFNVDWTIEEV